MEKRPDGKKGKVHHEVIGFKLGDWIVYRCSQCDYELHNHLTTHKIIVKNARRDINHSGVYQPLRVESTRVARKHGLAGGPVH